MNEETKKGKIQIFAISDYGKGSVQDLGIVDRIEDIRIFAGMFADDVVIELEQAIEDY